MRLFSCLRRFVCVLGVDSGCVSYLVCYSSSSRLIVFLNICLIV